MPLPGPPTPSSFPEGFGPLAELAFDLRSAWNHGADALWEALDADLWRETGNPWLVLQSASRERVRKLWSTPSFRGLADGLREERRREDAAPSWFQAQPAASALGHVAFFSLEFALSEALPMYSGGLGNVAGDILKTASDLGVPLVGVGLLYQQGYFRQSIDADGAQREFYPFNEPTQMPVVPVRDAQGEWVRVLMPRAGPPVWLRAWGARVGRCVLYLLDSNDPSNLPADRGITAQLYGGGPEVRLLQEVVLGIGGWRLLRALGVRPDICHLNEGHAALAAVERARDFMREKGQSFAVAMAATRPGNVFTTHTPVEAGFDRFSPEIVKSTLGAYVRDELGISLGDFLALGRVQPEDEREPLSMAWLAARASGAMNGVSRRHGEVSRKIFQVLFPRWPEREVPIGYVTNGVHVATWDSAAADALWTRACGKDRWLGDLRAADRIRSSSDAELWALRSKARTELVTFARERVGRQLAASGVAGEKLEAASRLLDGDALTIGLARRFTAYKRPTLLLHDAERFANLLKSQARPVQIVVAGKAHPHDEEGKGLVSAWVRFVRRSDVRARAVFLADYDVRLAERLVRGVDLWLNTPRPPWEACGTSGMKVLVNGGINLSALDGWWQEAYRPEVGWALPHDESDERRDAARLYELLEREVVPAFYDRDASGLPRAWIERMRESMSCLTPTYSANRALREYTDDYYVPGAQRLAHRVANGGAAAAHWVEWQRTVRAHWGGVRFGEVRVRSEAAAHQFAATVYLDDLDPESLAVELWADDDGSGSVRVRMRRDSALVGSRGYVYVAEVQNTRPANHFTPRAVPAHPDACVPLELPLVTWAR
ncbi:MAG: alpha-glucan family phosphorylase [Polyangiaceae bacterium]|jgi:starch phosphorylase